MISPQAIMRFRGDSAALTIPLYSPDTDAAYTPVGPLLFSLKEDDSDADIDSILQKLSNVGGITLANPSVVTFVSADADLVEAQRFYVWSILDTSNNRTVARGIFWTEQRITRDGSLSIPTVVVDPSSPYLSAEEIEANRAAAEAAAAAAQASADAIALNYTPLTKPNSGYRFKADGAGGLLFQLFDTGTNQFRSVWLTNGIFQAGPAED